LNVFYNIYGIFAEDSIEKIFSFEMYRVPLSLILFKKCSVIGTVVTFLPKYQYRYRRYFYF